MVTGLCPTCYPEFGIDAPIPVDHARVLHNRIAFLETEVHRLADGDDDHEHLLVRIGDLERAIEMARALLKERGINFMGP